MKKIVKSSEEDADESSPFSRLPDELILKILNTLIDLKTLCFCHLLSKRFSSIVLQVDAISFTVAPLNSPVPAINTFSSIQVGTIASRYCQSSRSALTFLCKFRGVKSLYIEIPPPSHRGNDNRCLLKWRAKFGNAIKFFFLSPDSISDTDGKGEGEEEEDINFDIYLLGHKLRIAFQCLSDCTSCYEMLLYIVKDLPMLEKVSITDSERRGRFSLSGGKLAEVKNCMNSDLQAVESGTEDTEVFMVRRLSQCYLPLLELPDSGLVMKGVTFYVMEMGDVQGGNDSLMISEEDGFEGKEEAAYTEAVMEILKKHKHRIRLVYEKQPAGAYSEPLYV